MLLNNHADTGEQLLSFGRKYVALRASWNLFFLLLLSVISESPSHAGGAELLAGGVSLLWRVRHNRHEARELGKIPGTTRN